MDNKLITVTSPLLPNLDDLNEMLKQIWASKWITNNGQFHKQLEKELAAYLKVPYISLFTNGTLPLITALQALIQRIHSSFSLYPSAVRGTLRHILEYVRQTDTSPFPLFHQRVILSLHIRLVRLLIGQIIGGNLLPISTEFA